MDSDSVTNLWRSTCGEVQARIRLSAAEVRDSAVSAIQVADRYG